MHYIPDIIAMLCLFPSGIVYGFYFKSFDINATNIWVHWYALVAIVCCAAVSSILTVKKVRDKKYKFDHFYIIFIGIVCFLISGFFLLDKQTKAAFYFGLAGHGIVYIPVYTYLSIRSSKAGYRPARIALANTAYFAGVAGGFSTFLEINLETRKTILFFENGWTLLGIGIILISAIILNEILQITKAYNYKKSRDMDWNMHNEKEILFQNEQKVQQQAHRGQCSEFIIGQGKQNVTVIFLFCTLLERVTNFSLILLSIGIQAGFIYTGNFNFYAPFAFYAGGCAVSCVTLSFFKPKITHLLLSLIKIAATIALIVVYNTTQMQTFYPFICIYFTAMGVISSIPIQGLLESIPFKYTELIFGLGYIFEMFLIEALKYEQKTFKNHDYWPNLLADGIAFSLISLISTIFIQMYLIKSEGLIEMRNKLIGLRMANFIPRSRVWSTNWIFSSQNPPSTSNVSTVTFDRNRTFQTFT